MSSSKAAAAKGIVLLAVAATTNWFNAATALYWLLRIAGRAFEETEHDHG